MKKRVLILFGILLLGIVCLYVWLSILHKNKVHELKDTHTIMFALMCYAELNGGSLPDDWNGLIESGVAKPLAKYPHGLYFPRFNSSFVRTGGSREIVDIRKYGVMFGTDAEDIVVTDSEVLDRHGKPVLLVFPTGTTHWDNDLYRNSSVTIAKAMKECAKGNKGK